MVVVTDSVLARIFTAETSRSPLTEVQSLNHEEGRLHDRDLTSDLSGGMAGRDGSGGHSYTLPTDPKKHELSEFARRIATYIDDERKANRWSSLILVAAPTMLGELRNHLSADAKNSIVREVAKNLVSQRAEDIRSYFPTSLLSEAT